VAVGTADEVELGAEQRGEEEVALESRRTVAREDEVDVEPEAGAGGTR
jgi:hypothetical protein